MSGLIPACAGKTPYGKRLIAPRGAHPRVCGENSIRSERLDRQTGSSPRVRGKLTGEGFIQGLNRLIPACAGKTRALGKVRSAAKAHPRVCGENRLGKITMPYEEGSSPRVRGKPVFRGSLRAGYRLIPACAGKTSRGNGCRARRPAHPRVCGENSIKIRRRSGPAGSSPRVRGKHILRATRR